MRRKSIKTITIFETLNFFFQILMKKHVSIFIYFLIQYYMYMNTILYILYLIYLIYIYIDKLKYILIEYYHDFKNVRLFY